MVGIAACLTRHLTRQTDAPIKLHEKFSDTTVKKVQYGVVSRNGQKTIWARYNTDLLKWFLISCNHKTNVLDLTARDHEPHFLLLNGHLQRQILKLFSDVPIKAIFLG